MQKLLLTVVKMSLTGSIIILAVILLRLLMKRMPKKFSYVLWLIPAIRLLCPIAISSPLSAFNLIKTDIPQERIEYVAGSEGLNYVSSAALSQTYEPGIVFSEEIYPIPDNKATEKDFPEAVFPGNEGYVQKSVMPDVLTIMSYLWATVAAGVLIYSIISYIIVHIKVKGARKEGSFYISDKFETPFVFGFIKPKIYLTENLSAEDTWCIVAHERAHIKRFDHIIKLVCVPILALHWFNPIVWLGIKLMCADMELSCDELALTQLGSQYKKTYATALLNMSVRQNHLEPGWVLCFGEKNIKSRIKGVLNMEKPTIIAVIFTVAVIVVASVCLLTGPKTDVKSNSTDSDNSNIENISDSANNEDVKSESDVSEVADTDEMGDHVIFNMLTLPDLDYETAIVSYEGAAENVLLHTRLSEDYYFHLFAEKAFKDTSKDSETVYASKLQVWVQNGAKFYKRELPGKDLELRRADIDTYISGMSIEHPFVVFNSPNGKMYVYSVGIDSSLPEGISLIGEVPEGNMFTGFSIQSGTSSGSYITNETSEIRYKIDFIHRSLVKIDNYYNVTKAIQVYMDEYFNDLYEDDLERWGMKIDPQNDYLYDGLAYPALNGVPAEEQPDCMTIRSTGVIYPCNFSVIFRDNTSISDMEKFLVVDFLDDAGARVVDCIDSDLKYVTGVVENDPEDRGMFTVLLDPECADGKKDQRIITDYTSTIFVSGKYTLLLNYRSIAAGMRVKVCYNGEVDPETDIVNTAYIEVLSKEQFY